MIRLTDDLGAPAVVFAADWVTQAADGKSSVTSFKWNRPIGIALAAAGYILGGWLGYGKTFTKNMGIASFDWAANSIKSYISEQGVASGVGHRVTVRPRSRVSSYPAQPKNAQVWPMAV